MPSSFSNTLDVADVTKAEGIDNRGGSPLAGRSGGERLLAVPRPWQLLVLVLSGLGVWQWDSLLRVVREEPLVSALSGLVVGLLTALTGIAVQVYKRLQRSWVDSCADRIDIQVRRLLPRFRRRYYRQLVYRHRFLNVRGLRTQGTFSLELDKTFVQLRIAPQSPAAVTANPLHAERQPGSRSIWELLASDHESFRCLAVLGPPGSGKTTLLQHLATSFARNVQRRFDRSSRAYLPILLILREHIDAVTGDSPPTLAELVTGHEEREGLAPPKGWFAAKLEGGRCLVLLDGLDEVADAGKRQRVAAWVDRQCRRYGRCRFIVTSRPHGYRTNPLGSAAVLEVQPLSVEDVERFVRSWYLANEILSAQRDDPGVRADAERQVQDLLSRLASTPVLSALAVNPLLLTMIALVHRYRGQLPARRIELYSEICDVLLGHWQAAKGLSCRLTPAQKRAVLQPLALYMMEKGLREIERERAERITRAPLARVGITESRAEVSFLKCVRSESGLLVEREVGLYSFAHLTFQEHLAALHLHELRAEEQLYNRLDDPWWHETVRLYAAQTDATGIIRACLAVAAGSDTPAIPLALAYQCLNEARDVEPGTRDELDRCVLAGLESGDAEQRRLAAEVLLALRLQGELARINGELEIDASQVSCAEYQLFLDWKHCGAEHLPAHWRQPSLQPGTALQPVMGISHRSATAFCSWLTARRRAEGESGYRYRLPTSDELEMSPLQPGSQGGPLFTTLRSASVGTWCQTRADGVHGGAAGAHASLYERSISAARASFLETGASALRQADDPDPVLVAARTLTYAISHQLYRIRRELQRPACNLVCHIASDLSGDLDLVNELARAFTSARRLCRMIVRQDAESTAVLTLSRGCTRILERTIELARTRDLARDLKLACVRAGDLESSHDIAADLKHGLGLTRSCAGALSRARSLAGSLGRVPTGGEYSRARVESVRLARAIDLARAAARARARACTIALAGAIGQARDLGTKSPALERAANLSVALERALRSVRGRGAIRTDGTPLIDLLDRTLQRVFACPTEIDLAWFRAPLGEDDPLHRLELTLQGIARIAASLAADSWQGQTEPAACIDLLELWAGFALLRGRMADELPVWEGIRLVRERLAAQREPRGS